MDFTTASYLPPAVFPDPISTDANAAVVNDDMNTRDWLED